MYTHQLTELLKTFTGRDLMRFGKFLNSPYFNNRKMMIKLFRVLKRFYPEFEGKNFTREYLFKLIYGNNAEYNDSTFRNLMSDLLKLSQQFLKQEGIEKRGVESGFFLTQELFSRGAVSLFLSQMANNENELSKRNIIDGDYFISRFKIETGRFYVNLMTQKTIKKSLVITESEKLVNGIVCIICYFVIESIKHNDVLLNYSRTYNIRKNIDIVSNFLELFNFEKINSFIRGYTHLNVPVVELYYKLLKTFLNIESSEDYFEMKRSLHLYSKRLGLNDNNFLHSRLIDYCIYKKNQGIANNFDIDRELFELHDILLKNEYYKNEFKRHLTVDLYRNVLINCIALRELRYMEDFISKYTKKLMPKEIANIENYSNSLLNFEKGLYHKALNYLNKVKFDQFVFKLDMKNLQLKINFELEYYESALSVIDTYKHFLKNNQLISESRKIMHNSFLSYTQMIIQSKTGSKKVNLSYLSDKIKNSKNVFDKVWLLEKIRDLKMPAKRTKVA